MNPVHEFLRKVPLFANLEPAELDDVVRCVRPQSLRAGQRVFKQGAQGDAAYLIQSGKVEVFTRNGTQEVAVATLGPGEVFGELSLVDGGPRSASVRAVEATEVLRLDRAEFDFLRRSRRPVAFKLLLKLTDTLAARIVVTRRLIGEAARPKPRGAPPRRPSTPPSPRRPWGGGLPGPRRESGR